MEIRAMAVLLERDRRALALGHAASRGNQQSLDAPPFQRPVQRVREYGRKRLAMGAVHARMISISDAMAQPTTAPMSPARELLARYKAILAAAWQAHVRDGDSVQAGHLLVELDPTNAQADQSSVQEQYKAADADLRRAQALLGALNGARIAGSDAHLQSEWQDIQARLAKLDAEHSRRQAEAATVREAIATLDATLPLARQREADVKMASRPTTMKIKLSCFSATK